MCDCVSKSDALDRQKIKPGLVVDHPPRRSSAPTAEPEPGPDPGGLQATARTAEVPACRRAAQRAGAGSGCVVSGFVKECQVSNTKIINWAGMSTGSSPKGRQDCSTAKLQTCLRVDVILPLDAA